uniref:Uncharacterized protein n=1 Tax=Rhizophora mucronata TaxID=61149 RepID=A0A2P2NZ32_RHIMU
MISGNPLHTNSFDPSPHTIMWEALFTRMPFLVASCLHKFNCILT